MRETAYLHIRPQSSGAISLARARLQRMLLRLSTYNLQVKYSGSMSVLLADTLSRLVGHNEPNKEVPGLDKSIAQVLKVEPISLESLQEETKVDPALAELSDFIITGWPESKQDLPQHLHPYRCFRDELTILDKSYNERQQNCNTNWYASWNTQPFT